MSPEGCAFEKAAAAAAAAAARLQTEADAMTLTLRLQQMQAQCEDVGAEVAGAAVTLPRWMGSIGQPAPEAAAAAERVQMEQAAEEEVG